MIVNELKHIICLSERTLAKREVFPHVNKHITIFAQ